ncbi:MAG: hypothetical protein ACOCZR_02000 [Halanaerobiales bacterium]
MRELIVPKIEGDYSDVLFARGIAEIANQVLKAKGREVSEIIIENKASYYTISLDEELKKENFQDIQFKCLYPLIFYDKMDEKPAYTSDLVDFTEEEEASEWDRNKRLSTLIRQATGIPLSNKLMNAVYELRDYFGEFLYHIVNFYSEVRRDYSDLSGIIDELLDQIQLDNFKKKIKDIMSPEELEEIESDLDDLFADFDNYHWTKRNKVEKFIKNNLPQSENTQYISDNIKEIYSEAKIDFKSNQNALSSLLPRRVKGVNVEDLSSDSRISPKNTSEYWLRLFIIMIGFYQSFIMKNVSGNRIYSVIDPARVKLNNFDEIYSRIEPDYYPGSTLEKQNILYLSDFIVKLLDYIEEFEEQNQIFIHKRNKLSNLVKGLKSVYLVDMGQNYVIKNIYNLNIPNWILLNSEEEADKFKEVFNEIDYLIRPINDDNEDIMIFQELYRFLTTENVEYLLNYYYYHAILAMQRLGNDDGARIYTKKSMKFILSKLEEVSDVSYSGILENEGFQNFGRAIRNSTLIPIYLGEKKKIKFGLLQDLKRASLNKDTLITELSEFMATYNNENGLEAYHNLNKGGHQKRANLTTQDLKEIVGLIDDHDSKIIGNMLLAYGFGKDKKVKEVKGDNKDE